jgi:hypothetical protein
MYKKAIISIFQQALVTKLFQSKLTFHVIFTQARFGTCINTFSISYINTSICFKYHNVY